MKFNSIHLSFLAFLLSTNSFASDLDPDIGDKRKLSFEDAFSGPKKQKVTDPEGVEVKVDGKGFSTLIQKAPSLNIRSLDLQDAGIRFNEMWQLLNLPYPIDRNKYLMEMRLNDKSEKEQSNYDQLFDEVRGNYPNMGSKDIEDEVYIRLYGEEVVNAAQERAKKEYEEEKAGYSPLFPNLKILNLSGNNFYISSFGPCSYFDPISEEGIVASFLKSSLAGNLEVLNLSNCGVGDLTILNCEEIQLPSLVTLDLSTNKIDESFLKHVFGYYLFMENLEELNLSGNPFSLRSKVFQQFLQADSFPKLKRLTIPGYDIPKVEFNIAFASEYQQAKNKKALFAIACSAVIKLQEIVENEINEAFKNSGMYPALESVTVDHVGILSNGGKNTWLKDFVRFMAD